MLRVFPQNCDCISLRSANLVKVKTMAIRRGVWFRALSKIERAQIDLTIRFVEKVRSLLLAKVLDSILRKLFEAMNSMVWRLMRDVGMPQAKKLSDIAKGWGCKSARTWAHDFGFVQFLAVNYMNTPRSCRVWG